MWAPGAESQCLSLASRPTLPNHERRVTRRNGPYGWPRKPPRATATTEPQSLSLGGHRTGRDRSRAAQSPAGGVWCPVFPRRASAPEFQTRRRASGVPASSASVSLLKRPRLCASEGAPAVWPAGDFPRPPPSSLLAVATGGLAAFAVRGSVAADAPAPCPARSHRGAFLIWETTEAPGDGTQRPPDRGRGLEGEEEQEEEIGSDGLGRRGPPPPRSHPLRLQRRVLWDPRAARRPA